MIFSSPTSATAAVQNTGGRETSYPGGPSLAQEALVCGNCEIGSREAVVASMLSRSAFPRSHTPSCFTVTEFDGLAIEARILKDQGISGPVFTTLINARKPTSRNIYYRVLKSYISWCDSKRWLPHKYVIGRIIAFLWLGVDLKLSLGTIKGQIAALSIFFQ